jgi:hypothetical protein
MNLSVQSGMRLQHFNIHKTTKMYYSIWYQNNLHMHYIIKMRMTKK